MQGRKLALARFASGDEKLKKPMKTISRTCRPPEWKFHDLRTGITINMKHKGNDGSEKLSLERKMHQLNWCTSHMEASTPTPQVSPRAFELWKIAWFKFPPLGTKKEVPMPHELVLKYFSSKTNFVVNQTLFTIFRERCAVMTPWDFFWRRFSKSYSLIKAKFYLVNAADQPCKNFEKLPPGVLRLA